MTNKNAMLCCALWSVFGFFATFDGGQSSAQVGCVNKCSDAAQDWGANNSGLHWSVTTCPGNGTVTAVPNNGNALCCKNYDFFVNLSFCTSSSSMCSNGTTILTGNIQLTSSYIYLNQFFCGNGILGLTGCTGS